MSALTDPIADFLTRLRNASHAKKTDLSCPHSKMKEEIARVLKTEGFITDFSVASDGPKFILNISTRFVGSTPALTGLQRVSRPGLRRYVDAGNVPRVRGGNGIAILSTPRGVLSGREARRQNLGGELLAFVY